ncbi:DUF1028 domain-containing protein [Bradyrhizobium canariense]|uniref:Uncharacterized conserved protein, Ntn-hydrolase superfamily n=1 Tax=Bradyrhizobium canariense TaxID=255045 RepID=A0A1H1XLE1_9BRAD|nr:DUF1028 domain-containing protein [Bradyrhizobium canariense]SDT10022.1 Uncharacterized conserved protein, Ntn-hydrolase superfamily [Bradyrhizobium canariense]
MTFSLTARCPETGMFGMVISSSSPAVAARCVHLRAKAGAVASQNVTDPALGQIGLDLLARGLGAHEVCAALVASTPFMAYRQLALVDAFGRVASYSGSNTLGIHAVHSGEGVIAAGNLLSSDQVPAAMVRSYQDNAGKPFATRLVAALRAGLDQGGEAGPVHSAGLCVVREVSWAIVDLRVDWSDRPIAALEEVWAAYEPQVEDYVRRARNPSAAPGFGVPGDSRV